MPIEIRCSNISGFDAKTQTYRVCNQRLRVPESRLGTTIECPKCHQEITLTVESVETRRGPENYGSPPAQLDPHDAGGLLRPDIMELEFESITGGIRHGVHEHESPRCPKCGGRYSEDGICTACSYADPIQLAERKRRANAALKPAGFQLWLSKLTREGFSISKLGYILFSLITLLCGLAGFAGILSTSLMGALIAAASALLWTIVLLVALKTRQLATAGNIDLGVLAPFWSGTLAFARWLNWQKYDSRLQGRTIIDMRQHPVTNDELAKLPALNKCQVLDLQNSPIDDNGLLHLYGLNNLQCLVLKDTRVSREGITNLQQHRPLMWIWY